MSNTSDGPAFPIYLTARSNEGTLVSLEAGLTKRELFAADAMKGLCANMHVVGYSSKTGWALVNCTPEQLSAFCVEMADALLLALSKPEAAK